MKYIKALVPSIIAITIMGMVSTLPALAKDGGDDRTSGSTSTSSSTSNENEITTSETSDHTETKTPEVNTELEHETEVKNQARAESILNDLKDKQGQKNSDAAKRQNCENGKSGIETKVTALSTNAARYQARLDTTLQLAQAYQKSSNLTVTNWDTLVAAATNAQTKAVASVAALKALNVTIDCTQPSVASQVATIKAAAGQARTDLQAYKQAVIALLTAIENAKTQGGN